MAMAIPILTKDGIPGYSIRDAHPDVVGKWGGHKAYVVHYSLDVSPDDRDRMEMYLHIGNYYEVGQYAPFNKVSGWEITNLFVESMNENNFGGWSILIILWMMIKYRMQRL